jgi:hypothetical protein
VQEEIVSHIKNTKSNNTKQERLPYLLKVKDVTTENKLVLEVKPNQFSKRKLKLPKRFC